MRARPGNASTGLSVSVLTDLMDFISQIRANVPGLCFGGTFSVRNWSSAKNKSYVFIVPLVSRNMGRSLLTVIVCPGSSRLLALTNQRSKLNQDERWTKEGARRSTTAWAQFTRQHQQIPLENWTQRVREELQPALAARADE